MNGASLPPPMPPDAVDVNVATGRYGDTGARLPPRFVGPLSLALALTRLARGAAEFTRDGPRADVEYRDLGWADASGGAIGAKHIRALHPFEHETGWHW